MLTIFDLATQDAITNQDNSWFLELIEISEGKYDKEDNEIKNLEEMRILNKNGKKIYYHNLKKGEISELDFCLAESIEKSDIYKIAIQRNINAGILKFYRKMPGSIDSL